MIKKFLRITLLVVICLTFAGKMALADSCDNVKSSQKQTVISAHYSNSSDCDSMDCDSNCNCHCHHGHLDFVLLTNFFAAPFLEIENNDFNSVALISSQAFFQKKPPKLVS